MFIGPKNISIFKKIDKLVNSDIYIGDEEDSNFPTKAFKKLLDNFPNNYELKKYTDARITSILRDYFDRAEDAEKKYENYINKKISHKGAELINILHDQEQYKYQLILKKLKAMLDNEEKYNEKQWQVEILEIIQLIYPKYIGAFEEVIIKDTYNNKDRKLDFMLIDSNGNIDVIEVKRPFGKSIVSQNQYRDNYIPLRELSGSVMQIEKYIFYLNKWGIKGEEILTDRYKSELPQNFKIKITNPEGLIIMGRENDLTSEQLADFEVIKRKYNNIIDIITYDELISRIEKLINKFY